MNRLQRKASPFLRPFRLRMLRAAARQNLASLFALLALFLPGSGQALMEMSAEEFALLPEVCRYKKYVSSKHPDPPRSEKWEAYFGKDFEPIHHYCWALVHLARSYRVGRTAMQRQWDLINANNDLDFVLQNSSRQLPIRAEIFTRRIEIRIQQRDERGAEDAFRDAVAADPAYWKSYVVWGYYLFQRGKQQQALRVVEEGQKNAPGNAKLDRLAAELRAGGKARR